ncbi:type VI secretion system baseplate subunit TssF [Paraliomyxa miuraensis]|uniref:type VI secretion system baseplate subunit TssF n=1 Tax=Paraliomyxa miuraensis TaxID=376150 RepID=UPI0022507BF7|nr:type VI secretion system baseplate subunit TssF [Paraliomyxa miuraensis]MCX4244134.1 type VI secretion system baseplate subunit TssF [Paraliomyxa miuraensis]
MDPELYQGFLTELQALDELLLDRHRGPRHVEREDPDVRRLMEALALFTARSRHAATEAMRGAVHRLVHGHLDDLMVPQPTRGMMRAMPSSRLTDPVWLPRGTPVRVQTQDEHVGLFTTTRDLTIRPLQLDWAERQLRGRRGFRILLRVQSLGVTRQVPEPLPLSLFLDHAGDYPASLRLRSRLGRHLQAISVVYDRAPTANEAGAPCRFRLGSGAIVDPAAPRPARESPPVVLGSQGAVARIRELFHHPISEHFLDIELAEPDRSWRQAWLCLDLDEHWPEDQVINEAMFRLFVVPIENLFSQPAEPIKADGTRMSFPVRSWSPELRASFHSVAEVSQLLESGSEAILPSYIASGRDSYEVELEGDGGEPTLRLRLPDAFVQPRVVSVLARWYQPWFDGVAVGKLAASLQTRHVEGVELKVQGDLRPHEGSPLEDDAAAMLQVMARRSKRVLSRQDIIKLMTILGADERSHHGVVAADVLDVRTREEPADRHEGGGVAYVYEVLLAEADEDRHALQEFYLRRMSELLDSWGSNPVRVQWHRRAARKQGSSS